MIDIVVEILQNGDASVVKFAISEQDVRHVMAPDWAATASDGGAKLPSATKPHPRNYGAFPRKLAYKEVSPDVSMHASDSRFLHRNDHARCPAAAS
jgi:hypothetical protein